MLMDYAFNFAGHGTFTPDGRTEVVTDTVAHNRQVETIELAGLGRHPERVFLYVRLPQHARDTKAPCSARADTELDSPAITTWLGTAVTTCCNIGRSVPVGGIAGRHARKRSVDCRIFGTRYVGWYYETAGDYCRLRRATRQG